VVSIKSLGTLAVIGIAAAAFFGLGGAAGIGQRIGGGFSAFGSGIVKGFSSPFVSDLAGNQPAPQESNPFPSAQPPGTAPSPLAVPLGLPPSLSSFGFLSPTSGGILDISKLFTTRAIETRRSNVLKGASLGSTPFGGFESLEAQERGLIAAIRESATKFPGFFG